MTMLLDLADTTVLTAATSGSFDLSTGTPALDDLTCTDPSCFYCCGPETD